LEPAALRLLFPSPLAPEFWGNCSGSWLKTYKR
jgi:hypothetical protein